MTYDEWNEKYGQSSIVTARQIIEARIGQSLGPLTTMPRDLRNALSGLAKQLVKQRFSNV